MLKLLISEENLQDQVLKLSHQKKSGKEFADFVSQECLNNGLLVCNTGRESIKLGPPLIITLKALKKSLLTIHQAIKKAEQI